jgi:hypothetical protein
MNRGKVFTIQFKIFTQLKQQIIENWKWIGSEANGQNEINSYFSGKETSN